MDKSKVYFVRGNGHVVPDNASKEMRKGNWELCIVQFAHSIMRPYDSQDEERKNYINEVIQSEF